MIDAFVLQISRALYLDAVAASKYSLARSNAVKISPQNAFFNVVNTTPLTSVDMSRSASAGFYVDDFQEDIPLL